MTTQPRFDLETNTWIAPTLVDTASGEIMATADLERTDTVNDNDNETAYAIEYRLDGVIVHRSVHVHLKQGMFAEGVQASFG